MRMVSTHTEGPMQERQICDCKWPETGIGREGGAQAEEVVTHDLTRCRSHLSNRNPQQRRRCTLKRRFAKQGRARPPRGVLA